MDIRFFKNRRLDIFGSCGTKGSMYLVTLITLTILYILMMVFIQKIYLDIRTLRHTRNELRTLYTAHAGLEDVVYELRHPSPSGYFTADHGWFFMAPYYKKFPGFTPAAYESTYNIDITTNDLNSSRPSTFNVIVNADLVDGEYSYTRTLYAEGAWTLNKEIVYITKVLLK